MRPLPSGLSFATNASPPPNACGRRGFAVGKSADSVHPEASRAFEGDPDPFGIRPGRHEEVVLETSGVAIKDHVDARIHLPVAHASVMSDPGMPAARIAANQVVAPPGLLVQTPDLGV